MSIFLQSYWHRVLSSDDRIKDLVFCLRISGSKLAEEDIGETSFYTDSTPSLAPL